MERRWQRCVLSLVRTDMKWHGLHVLLCEAVFVIAPKDLCAWWLVLVGWFGFLGRGLVWFGLNFGSVWVVVGFPEASFVMCFGIHFGMTCFLKRVDFFAVSLLQPDFWMDVQNIYYFTTQL